MPFQKGHKPIAGFQKGHKGIKGFLGKHHTEAYKKYMSEKYKGRKMTWGDKVSKAKIGQHCSPETEWKKGHLPWNYKGGITPFSMQIRQCFKNRQWKSDIFTRDNFTCQYCGKRGGEIQAHHIKEFNLIIKENNIKTLEEALDCEELWNINNGITLCLNCHNKTKKYVRRVI